jgi:hypothetical protein
MLLLLPLHRVHPLRPAASTSRGATHKAGAGSSWSRAGGISASAAAASPPPRIDWTSTAGRIEGAAANRRRDPNPGSRRGREGGRRRISEEAEGTRAEREWRRRSSRSGVDGVKEATTIYDLRPRHTSSLVGRLPHRRPTAWSATWVRLVGRWWRRLARERGGEDGGRPGKEEGAATGWRRRQWRRPGKEADVDAVSRRQSRGGEEDRQLR